jgi:hypothetical protein
MASLVTATGPTERLSWFLQTFNLDWKVECAGYRYSGRRLYELDIATCVLKEMATRGNPTCYASLYFPRVAGSIDCSGLVKLGMLEPAMRKELYQCSPHRVVQPICSR